MFDKEEDVEDDVRRITQLAGLNGEVLQSVSYRRIPIRLK